MKAFFKLLISLLVILSFGFPTYGMRIDNPDGNMVKFPILENGAVPTLEQDNTSPTVIVPLNQVGNTTILSVVGAIDDRSITVTSPTGFDADDFIVIADAVENRYYVGRQIGAASGSVISVHPPLDFAYSSGATVTAGLVNMAVDGSSTPQIFSLRASDPGLPLVVDITRIIFLGLTASAVDLTTFGDGAALPYGILLRHVNGDVMNIFTVRTNGDLASLMYDFDIYAATNPQQGVDGFLGRMSFNGHDKLGVVIRVGPNEDIQLIIYDNLLTSFTFFTVIVEGHIVVPTGI